jgi:hypothetical protein
MRREDTVLFAVLAVGALMVPAALGVVFGWPVMVTALVVVVALGATALGARLLRYQREQELLRDQEAQRREQEAAAAAAAVPEEPVDRGRRMAGVPLPCAEPGYRFLFSATVFWSPAPNPVGMRHTNPEALALESIRARASQITADQAPRDHVAVGYQLAAALGTVLPDGSGQVVTWAGDVALSIPDDDDTRLRKITELRKQEQAWEHERAVERTMRAYLRNEVLDSPGSAVVWWLARHPDQVEDTARLIGPLAQLSAAAHDTPVHELFRDLVPEEPQVPRQVGVGSTPALDQAPREGVDGKVAALADELFEGREDDTQRRLFGYELGNLVDNHGRPDLAGQIRKTFGVPDPTRRLDRR